MWVAHLPAGLTQVLVLSPYAKAVGIYGKNFRGLFGLRVLVSFDPNSNTALKQILNRCGSVNCYGLHGLVQADTT